MTAPPPFATPDSRRAARLRGSTPLPAREGATGSHVRPRRLRRVVLALGVVASAVVLAGAAAAVTAIATQPAAPDAAPAAAPMRVSALPVPQLAAIEPTPAICDLAEVTDALAVGDDAAVIAAAGGGAMLADAVAAGEAPCIRLDDPARVWVVINKQRPYDPIDHRPQGLVMPDGVRNLAGGALRQDAATALAELVTAAREAGVGELAMESGFRSYQTQIASYGRQVAARGVDRADLVSARPGYSEHQSGLAVDLVACAGSCGSIDDLAQTAQGKWLVAHAWEYGWITRYEDGFTDTTGYSPEPWHLRYIGPDLARAYHDGGWHSLEEFFGLEAAPAYDD